MAVRNHLRHIRCPPWVCYTHFMDEEAEAQRLNKLPKENPPRKWQSLSSYRSSLVQVEELSFSSLESISLLESNRL